MRTEKQLQEYLRAGAKVNGVLFFKLHCEGQRGFPDVMLACNGRMELIELKSPSKTGKLSRLQIETHEKFRLEGIYVHVIDSTEEVDAIIEGITDD